MISESKIDDSFPDSQFFLDGYSTYSTPYRLDRNRNGGGIMLFVHNDIPSKMISIEKLPTENFLIVCFYHVTYEFESVSTLYSCLNVKELLARSRCHI